MYSSDIPKYYHILKQELSKKNKILQIYKLNNFIKLVFSFILFTKSVMPKRLTKMLIGIIHKLMHYLGEIHIISY
jgi:hypothetical protein